MLKAFYNKRQLLQLLKSHNKLFKHAWITFAQFQKLDSSSKISPRQTNKKAELIAEDKVEFEIEGEGDTKKTLDQMI